MGNIVLFPVVHIEKYKSLRDISKALQADMTNKCFLNILGQQLLKVCEYLLSLLNSDISGHFLNSNQTSVHLFSEFIHNYQVCPIT